MISYEFCNALCVSMTSDKDRIDLQKTGVHAQTDDFVNCLQLHSFLPIITMPTRVTESTSTLIDNILTNCPNYASNTGVICYDISDHYPIIAQFDFKPKLKKRHLPCGTKTCDYNAANLESFITKLNDPCIWDNTLNVLNNTGDTNTTMNAFHETYTSLFQTHFPEKYVGQGQRRTPRREWMTKGLVTSCGKKAKLFLKYLKSGNEIDKAKYLCYQSKLKKLLQTAERKFYSDLFSSALGNMKKT